MNRGLGRRINVGVAALLAFTGSATAIGLAVAPTTATATPVNLIQNGSFESVAKQTTTFARVLAGDSTSISNWTVDTPSIYGEGRGSVDVTANSYWNAEDGNYSLDLAGTSSAPGGVYQNVATTPGVEYSLSFWSAVNGDEKPGIKHTMGVSLNGSALAKIKAVGVGRPLHWVQNTVSFTASSTTSRIEFDDTTLKDHHQGPTLDNVSLTAVPDTITASPVSIPTQTTGASFTAPVATFTDSYPSAPPTDFAATIFWGDGTNSPGSISQSGSTYTVTGTQTYANNGNYTVEVDISSVAGSTASTSEMISVVDNNTGCTESGCSGTVSNPNENVSFDSTSDSGTIQTSVDPADNGPDCADPFRHAPQVVTVTDQGLDANIEYTVTFNNADAAGAWYLPFAVCYTAETPFTDMFGNTGVTTGLLPDCGSPVVAPCVESIVESPDPLGNPQDLGTVVEKIVIPPGDPKFH